MTGLFDDSAPTRAQVEARIRWVDLLKQGKYEPARGALARRDKDGTETRCCLGVACDSTVVGIELEVHDDGEVDGILEIDDATVLLPAKASEILGLREGRNPVVILDQALGFERARFGGGRLVEGATLALSTLNDAGVSHAELARLIHKDYVQPYLDAEGQIIEACA